MAGPMTGMTPERTPRPASRTEPQTGQGAGHGAGPCTGSLGGVRGVLALELSFIVAHGNADLIVPEPSPAEFIDGPVGLLAILENSNDCRLLRSHEFLLAEWEMLFEVDP